MEFLFYLLSSVDQVRDWHNSNGILIFIVLNIVTFISQYFSCKNRKILMTTDKCARITWGAYLRSVQILLNSMLYYVLWMRSIHLWPRFDIHTGFSNTELSCKHHEMICHQRLINDMLTNGIKKVDFLKLQNNQKQCSSGLKKLIQSLKFLGHLLSTIKQRLWTRHKVQRKLEQKGFTISTYLLEHDILRHTSTSKKN